MGGAEFFASLGDSGRGVHAVPMRACRQDSAAPARKVELEGGLVEEQLRKSWGRIELLKQQLQQQTQPSEEEDDDDDDEEIEQTDEYYEDPSSPIKKKKKKNKKEDVHGNRKRK